MQKIGVIDYGAGNVASVMKALDYAGADVELVSDADQLAQFDKLVLPGVGASKHTIERLKENHIDQALNDIVLKGGKPFLGICVGMQILAEDLHEFGQHKGLGWVKGDVVSLENAGVSGQTIPHMGWSNVEFGDDLKDLSSRLGRHKAFYFCHSYALKTDDSAIVQAHVEYGPTLTAGIAFDNIYAFQFHPEKSQVPGDILMQWFVEKDI